MRKYLLLILLIAGASVASQAATKQEMERARALVLKWGVRSMNSGSGYLDGAVVNSDADLDKAIAQHSTDKANKQKISLGGLPSESDYQEWDNAKMTSFWLNRYELAVPSGKDKSFCKSRLKSALGKVPATVTKVENEDENAAPADGEEPTEETTEEATDSVKTDDESLAIDEVENAAADPETEPLAAPGQDGEREAAPGSHELKSSGGNGWLIFFLIVLVLVVLALVGYATQIMARNRKELNEAEGASGKDKKNPRGPRGHASARPASAVHEAAEQPLEPLQAAQQPAAQPQQPVAHQPVPQPIRTAQAGAPLGAAAAAATAQRRRTMQPRIIYLSQANSDGVFLRADAQFSMGNSIFKMVTADGYSGTFSVIDDPSVHELALMMPIDFLAGACTGRNLQMVQGARTIVNDSTGTAIFEDGRWRVARKAQIHYAR